MLYAIVILLTQIISSIICFTFNFRPYFSNTTIIGRFFTTSSNKIIAQA